MLCGSQVTRTGPLFGREGGVDRCVESERVLVITTGWRPSGGSRSSMVSFGLKLQDNIREAWREVRWTLSCQPA